MELKMTKRYCGPWVIRSLLFTAGHNNKYMQQALDSDADCIVLDLEDAVPLSQKAVARAMIKDVLDSLDNYRKPVFVRINPIETGLTLLDLDIVSHKNLDGFIYPKAYCADNVKAFDSQLSLKEKTIGLEHGHFRVIVLMETPKAVINALEIAQCSKRLIGLLFGCEDFLTDMEGSHGPNGRSLHTPRTMIALAARAAGLIPLDTPYVKVRDQDGLREHIVQAKEIGFEGMLVMSPSQIPITNEMYSPTETEVKDAREIISFSIEAEKEDRGIAMYNGKFISPPTLARSRKTLSRHERILNFCDYCQEVK